MKRLNYKMDNLDEEIKKCIDKKKYVKFYRTVRAGEENISGFILDRSNDFLLIQNIEEFDLNGYYIIRKKNIDSILSSKTEKKIRQILDSENLLEKGFGLNKKIKLTSMKSIFTDLKKHDYFAIVECENIKEPTFNIGEIAKVSKKSVGIRYFSPEAIIEKQPTKIKFKEITLVKFDDRYTNIYRKYLKEEV